MLYARAMTRKEKAEEIYKRLLVVYPKPIVELNFTTPFELLVATIMAAQTTDKLVNTLTPALFKKYPTIKDMAEANIVDIGELIRKVNFFSNKAKNIKAAAQMIVEKHNGRVPETMEELDSLPGVARKTANVVLGHAFGTASGIVIDTHGIRMSHRLGLSDQKTPEKIEKDLMELLPQDKWIAFGSMITLHGRHLCVSRPHACEDCPLGDLCPEYKG
jgi:endonuclease III